MEIVSSKARSERLRELAGLFLRLGTTAFGGPAAHTAMMHEEVVVRRKWLSEGDFLDLLGATSFIPGPNSTELAIHIGHRRAGFRGLIVAGVCFILPAALLTFLLAWLYVKLGSLPQAAATLYGVKPVIVAVVVQALFALSRTALKTKALAVLGAAAAVASVAGAHELLVLFGAASLHAMMSRARAKEEETASRSGLLASVAVAGAAGAPAAGVAAVAVAPSSGAVFLVFAKIGSVLFGSGYVLLAFLRAELVVDRHWLTEAQLLDAVAVGQLTPGPVFTTATFVGHLIGGPWGALAATAGIFLPAFVFVALSLPLLPRLRRSPRASAFLDGLNVASLALMAVVTVRLARTALVDLVTVLIAVVAAALLVRFKWRSTWLVVAGLICGNIAHALR